MSLKRIDNSSKLHKKELLLEAWKLAMSFSTVSGNEFRTNILNLPEDPKFADRVFPLGAAKYMLERPGDDPGFLEWAEQLYGKGLREANS